MPTTYDRERDFAERLARKAGSLLVEKWGKVAVREKGPSDLVTEADLASQALVSVAIDAEFPDHTLLAEEAGATPDPSRPSVWIVDPLDGTINYAHGFPFWCVSIALQHAGTIVVGVIHDPVAGVTFTATRGGGAFKDGSPLRVSSADSLGASLISAGMPTSFARDSRRQLALFGAFSDGTHSVRRTGSTALNLAYIAAGGLDLFYATSVHPWDVAAGVLLVEEAGGTISNLDGSTYRLDQPTLLASNGLIHVDAVARIARATPAEAADS